MGLYHRLRIREQGFPPALYKEICATKPESRGKEDFILESKPGDEANGALIMRLIDVCERHSVPEAKVAGELGAYDHMIVRHYEKGDLEAAPLMMLLTQKPTFRERLTRDGSGRLNLPANQCGTSIKIASGMFNNLYVASHSARGVLERGQMAGLFFRETVRTGASNRATTEPLWEIDSDIKLPKMVNSLLNPHSAVPCYMIDERPYREGEPHYRRPEVLPLGIFDIARTFEQLGSEPGLVVSQRFYQHCVQNNIPLEVRHLPAWADGQQRGRD